MQSTSTNHISIVKLSLKVTLAKVDTMAAAIELKSLENIINDSEILKGHAREFEYKLDNKAPTAKLIKGAKRIPLEIVPNSSSCNLVFNLVKTGKDTLIPRL